MSTQQSLIIDWTACEGRGLCADLLPELLDTDPWGFPLPQANREAGARPKRPPGVLVDVPDQLESPARRAVHLCPRLALRLSE